MMIKLSFRKGGDKAFYTALKRSLKGQAWEVNAISTRPSNANTAGNGTSVRSGISGIMHAVETRAQTQDTHMSDALKDLEALMVKAKDMVKLAGELNERLTAVSAAPHPRLLGLAMENTPVTMDMIKDERIWVEELARELGGVLQGSRTGTRASEGTGGGMMKRRGIIALDEVWGGWNRARGVALIPPSTLVLVLPHLPTYTNPPIRALELPSSLKVLHAPEYAPGAFGDRIRAMLAIEEGGATATQDIGGRAGVPKSTLTSTSTTEIAQAEGITIALAEEMVQLVERDGGVSRDDGRCVIHERLSERSLEHDGDTGGGAGAWTGGGEVKWWINVFFGYVWDGQE
ncbi:hypothetical protein D9757_008654 [Collybiopsis confluens]|uniref:Vacuolar protein-sorting-associated protein 36 n=1 Tax=Collybiopsis confluens TaxID=2823264 RepID=A0A8H5M0J3_9AGAR|nr:hypothetical protein D9757_008654 [Collybiopsis confluens]